MLLREVQTTGDGNQRRTSRKWFLVRLANLIQHVVQLIVLPENLHNGLQVAEIVVFGGMPKGSTTRVERQNIQLDLERKVKKLY